MAYSSLSSGLRGSSTTTWRLTTWTKSKGNSASYARVDRLHVYIFPLTRVTHSRVSLSSPSCHHSSSSPPRWLCCDPANKALTARKRRFRPSFPPPRSRLLLSWRRRTSRRRNLRSPVPSPIKQGRNRSPMSNSIDLVCAQLISHVAMRRFRCLEIRSAVMFDFSLAVDIADFGVRSRVLVDFCREDE